MSDQAAAVRQVVPRITPVGRLWEVPCAPAVEVEQRIVPLAYDDHGCVARQDLAEPPLEPRART